MQAKLIKKIFSKEFVPVGLLIIAIEVYILVYERLASVLLKEAIVNLDKWIFTVFTVIVTLLIQRLLIAAIDCYGENIAKKTETSLDDEFLPLAKKISILLLWVIVSLIILGRFGINTSGIIAALGVSSLAIALAAQDTISNIISGFLIIVDRPYRIDDTIKLPSGEKVKVLEIGLRRSKFLAEDGAIIIVPNLALSKSKVVNYTYGEERK